MKPTSSHLLKAVTMVVALVAFVSSINSASRKREVVTEGLSFNIDLNSLSPTEFIQQYVLDSIAEWQHRNRYEPIASYALRVTEANRAIEVQRLIEQAQIDYIATYCNEPLTATLKSYDPTKEVFLFNVTKYGNISVPVPQNQMTAFEKGWKVNNSKNQFYIDGDYVCLKQMVFSCDGTEYLYDNTQAVVQNDFALTLPEFVSELTEADMALLAQQRTQEEAALQEQAELLEQQRAELEAQQQALLLAQQQAELLAQQTVQPEVARRLSDVDINIPMTDISNDKTFAVIIANENYRREVPVQYAINDGRTFKEYCNQTFGLPENHIHIVEDATLNDIRHEVQWITNIMTTQKGQANIIFYYAGHGIPDESSRKSYLLPTDGYGSDPQTAYPIDELYSTLGAIPAKSITYFIDACFSGSKREAGMLASARAVSIKARAGELSGNAVAFSAAQEDQTAYPYKEKEHGLFTYFLLKKLQESGGNVSLYELGEYIKDNVAQTSVITNSKIQTPSVTANEKLGTTWQGWTFK